MKKAVVLLSGGMDSTTLLYYLLSEKYEVKAVSVNYGQRHSKELQCAAKICESLGLDHKIIDLTNLQNVLSASCLTDHSQEVPEGHYAAENMKSTVVPNRNMIMLSVAAGFAISQGAENLCIANHSGDHAIYPDCRLEFIEAVSEVLKLCHFTPLYIMAPFTNISKADICKKGIELQVPFENTWSCYKGGEKHCGKCGTCVERKEAFELIGAQDPTDYEENK